MTWDAVAIWVFGASALTVLYVLFGYPCLLWLLSQRARPVHKAWTPRTVSIVMPVHNGEPWLAAKLTSIDQLDYPPALLQIIVIDDGSTDRTKAIAQANPSRPVEVLSLPRSGKAACLNAGLGRATGEIVLFTDVRQRLDSRSLRTLVECFADDTVGVVSGELIILSGTTDEEADIGLYWRYEKWIRKRLSRIDSVIGATGCLYAMRRSLAGPMPASTLLDDVYLPLLGFFKGDRVIFEEGARAYDYPTALQSEFRRKVRTQAGVYQIAGFFPRLLVPWTRMSFHFWSHKIGRLTLPFALLLIGASSPALPSPWNVAAVLAQACFYALALGDRWIPAGTALKRLSSIAHTFVVLMAAALVAPLMLLSRRGRSAGWKTTEVRPAALPRIDNTP